MTMRSPLDELLGIHITGAAVDCVTATVALDPARHHQPWGTVHGGLWCTVVETLATLGAQQSAPSGYIAVGLDNHTSFVRMAKTGTATAEARPVHRGRTAPLWRVAIEDSEGRLLAHGTCRLLYVATD